MEEIISFVLKNWPEWLIMGIFALCGAYYRHLIKAVNEDRDKNRAVAQGVEALLRDRIIDSYHKYEKTGICPIYAKENVKRLYVPYHSLGGNDIATELMEKLLEMPTAKM